MWRQAVGLLRCSRDRGNPLSVGAEKGGAAPKNPYPVQGIAVQAVPFRNSEAFRLHQNFFRKKGVKKFAGKEKGYTFAAANEVKRSNPSGLEKRRRGH